MTLSACAASVADAPLSSPVYPARPAFMAPVAVPEISAGQICRVALAEHRAGLINANGRLTQSGAWYDALAGGRK